jgi:glycosyltransferase involved in cell wall biosynthesis
VSAPAAARVRVSACIITFNEADRLEACLRSLDFCDEVLVVDSHSSDATRAIAHRCGARVIERDWPGYRSQREFAMREAKHDWILSVDADERVSAALRAELLDLCAELRLTAAVVPGSAIAATQPAIAGATVPTLTHYFGKFLRHGNAWPDRHPRFCDRRRARWQGLEIHERVTIDGPVRALRGWLEHYSYRSFDEHLAKMDRYAKLMAEHSFAAGKRATFWQVLFNPAWRFFRGLVLKRGFLDGWRGVAFHIAEAGYVRRKYFRLWMLQRQRDDQSGGGPE